MSKKICLMIIDPERDFTDPTLPAALYVSGGDKDMDRIAALVDARLNDIEEVVVTLDLHNVVDIAHPPMWIEKSTGKFPNPYTPITLKDIEQGKFRTRIKEWMERFPGKEYGAMEYVRKLEQRGRNPLIIWPIHCLISRPGSNLHPTLEKALRKWEDRFAMITFCGKGSNPFTEHYSAVEADVPDPSDPSTGLNTDLIKTIKEFDEIWFAGEALDYCCNWTIRDLGANFGEKSLSKFRLIMDGMSAVNAPGATHLAPDFLKWADSMGVRRTTVRELIDEGR